MAELHSLQVELFGMNTARRADTEQDLRSALAALPHNYESIDANRSIHGEVCFFAQVDGLETRADGQQVFDLIVAQARARGAADAPSGRHSKVELATQDSTIRSNTVRAAISPTWTENETVQNL